MHVQMNVCASEFCSEQKHKRPIPFPCRSAAHAACGGAADHGAADHGAAGHGAANGDAANGDAGPDPGS
jgi:hypothetical protein